MIRIQDELEHHGGGTDDGPTIGSLIVCTAFAVACAMWAINEHQVPSPEQTMVQSVPAQAYAASAPHVGP